MHIELIIEIAKSPTSTVFPAMENNARQRMPSVDMRFSAHARWVFMANQPVQINQTLLDFDIHRAGQSAVSPCIDERPTHTHIHALT